MSTSTETSIAENFDHHSPEFRESAHESLAAMRSRCPVAHSEQHGGFWTLLDYPAVFEASRDDDLFNSFPSVGVPASGAPSVGRAATSVTTSSGESSEGRSMGCPWTTRRS